LAGLARQAGRKKEEIIVRRFPRAALVPRLPWDNISSSLQDFSLVLKAELLSELEDPSDANLLDGE
jgi:hypothetical protein